MKSRKRINRKEKEQILEAVQGYIGQDTEIEVKTEKRTYKIRIKDDQAILPSGKVFEIDARHIV